MQTGGTEYLFCLAFSPDGKSLAQSVIGYGNGSHQLRIYDVGTGELRKAITVSHHIDRLAYTRDGRSYSACCTMTI